VPWAQAGVVVLLAARTALVAVPPLAHAAVSLLLVVEAVGKTRTGASRWWESPITLPSRAPGTTAECGAGARLAVVVGGFDTAEPFPDSHAL
jgi:hypothetical protein